MYPVIFESSLLTVYSLWLFFTLGFVLGSFIFYQLINNSRLDISFITNNAFKFLIGALISSRIFAIIINYHYFFRIDPEKGFSLFGTLWTIISVWDKELSFWGAVVGFLFIFIREAQKELQNFAKWTDILTISLLSGLSIGNIGAYLDGVNYGRPTILFWGVTYQSSFVKYAVPVHPTQLYACIYTALIAIFLYLLYKRYRNKYDGLIAYTGFFLFASFRFLEGFFRGDDVKMLGAIRLPETIFLIVAIVLGYLMRKYQKRYNIPIFSLIPKYLRSRGTKN
ncbi:hypothetical protein COV81_04270 [Candidatus Peregrinibacteria bacterium CG11_big_fil_rev_8_21_14_0_20_41_10]|nr:MAG: hypothetical protein COV81_04270 [Candidatus Peregrinibacteria bacterium CG11_big_fil_rev_8_21_14_0_20_41_10]PIZ74552.1 MAG: hypothetical protein COY06_04055 [Candidatus Peregrinibacteria bacterium CG_4_10_14_0_2_um_filter_41_8]PJC38148.1 MAG: hypothetical protein CO045_01765 [Candidatus Peregrinibacteria bacterium CG_4_9_14_0_2_um_filter_41_14]